MKHVLAILTLFVVALSTAAQSYPPAWNAGASYAVGDQVQLNGNVLRAVRAITPGGFKYAYWELWEVRQPTTVLVGVGQTFPTLVSAWTYIENCRISQGAQLKLMISTAKGDFAETFTAPFNLDHPFGANISIVGDNESNIQLNFNESQDGFDLDSGHTFGNLQNLNVHSAYAGNGGKGISVSDNATFANIDNVAIDSFAEGIHAVDRGVIDCGSGVTITNFTEAAAHANNGSIVFNTPVSVAGLSSGTSSYGFIAQYGGLVSVGASTVSNCLTSYGVDHAGVIYALGSTADAGNVGQYGYFAQFLGFIECQDSTATGTFTNGVSNAPWVASSAALIRCTGFTYSGATATQTGIGNNSQIGFIEHTG